MALFTDGPAVTVDVLTQHDSNLLDVSNVEGINLTTKLALAHDEVGLEIRTLLERSRTNYLTFAGTAHFNLRNVVITSPIRLWDTYHTLVLVYRDAYFSQLNDRYKAKWDEYRSMAKWAKDKLLETGVGLVNNPIVRAGAPSISQTAAAESGGTFYLSVTFVNGTGEEGAPSAVTSVTTTDGMAPDVQAQGAPENAAGWNLYAGTAPDTMFLQNSSPLDLGTDCVFYPSSAVTNGATPANGQEANFCKALPRLLQRG